MKPSDIKKPISNTSEKELLERIAVKLQNVVLFPEKLEEAKEYMRNAKMKTK
jgi:hypothetical protein